MNLNLPFIVFIVSNLSKYVKTEEKFPPCYCVIEKRIETCPCDSETSINNFNSEFIKKLDTLLERNYFRYFLFNGKKQCKIKNLDFASGFCRNEACSVKICDLQSVPSGILQDCDQFNIQGT